MIAPLHEMGAIESDAVASFVVLGKLGLDGRVNAISAYRRPRAVPDGGAGGEAASAADIDVVVPGDLVGQSCSQFNAKILQSLHWKAA
jgi:hypothetical protein